MPASPSATSGTQTPGRRHGATGNELLDAIPAPTRSSVLSGAELLSLRAEQELARPGQAISRLFFPTTAVFSLLLGLRSGQRVEAGMVGNEGFVGVPAVVDVEPDEFAVVQVPGEAYAVSIPQMMRLLERDPHLRKAVLRFVGYAYRVAKQTTLCNAYHGIEQRAARWLLATHERARSDRFPLTQELLSHMVAATRARTGQALARLRAAGVIDYRRGVMQITSRRGLETRSCECYAATRHRRGGVGTPFA